MLRSCVSVCALAMVAGSAVGQVQITEWMYSGEGGEFIEFTNVGNVSVDISNWSYDDDSRAPGTFSFGAIGTLAPGESFVIAEDDEATFRSDWSLDPSVKVLGGYTNNIGRNDEINLYDASNVLVDRLTYGDGDFPGSIRTQGESGQPLPGGLGANDPFLWALSFVGDDFGSYASSNGDVGTPGVLPAPGTAVFATLGLAALGRRRRG